jgi:four helix bundle protein
MLNYRELRVWQKAVDLTVEVYRLTESFPKKEIYGISAQARRSAISVAANIAEGHGRLHLGDYIHHLSIARGSIMELETHLLMSERLSFCNETELRTAFAMIADINPKTESRTPNTGLVS